MNKTAFTLLMCALLNGAASGKSVPMISDSRFCRLYACTVESTETWGGTFNVGRLEATTLWMRNLSGKLHPAQITLSIAAAVSTPNRIAAGMEFADSAVGGLIPSARRRLSACLKDGVTLNRMQLPGGGSYVVRSLPWEHWYRYRTTFYRRAISRKVVEMVKTQAVR